MANDTLAVAPSDPSVVWAGTGEAWAIRDSDVIGDGIYKSTDAGKTWTDLGLRNAQQIGGLAIDPCSPDTVFAAGMGHPYGASAQRGVYRSTDGGATWSAAPGQ